MNETAPEEQAFPTWLRGAAGGSLPRRLFWLGCWLFFLALPISGLLSSDASTSTKVTTIVAVVVFSILYVSRILTLRPGVQSASRLRGSAVWAMAAACAAIAVWLNLSQGVARWNLLFIFLLPLIAWDPDTRRSITGIGVVVALTIGTALATGSTAANVVSYALTIAALGFVFFTMSRLMIANRQLDAARHELARVAVVKERARFARDLHDLLGHSLSMIALKAEVARQMIDTDTERASREIGEIELVARSALREVREAVSGYRQPTVASELVTARTALIAAGVRAEITPPDLSLPPEVESLFAWAIREGTTNVVRHARASRCAISAGVDHGVAHVEVSDDGTAPDVVYGNGLTGISERAIAAGGRMTAGPNPDGGFTMRVWAPVAEAACRTSPVSAG